MTSARKVNPLGVQMAQVLKRLYLARKARNETRAALARHFADSWGPDENGYAPGAHKFGGCQELVGAHSEELTALCPVCAASAPLHSAYVTAAREAGNALRQAQAWGKRLVEEDQS